MKRTPSAKRRAFDKEAAEIRDQVNDRWYQCVVHHYGVTEVTGVPCGAPWPHRQETEVHELVTRARWLHGLLDPNNRVVVCQVHHDWVGANIEKARTIDLYRSRIPAKGQQAPPFDPLDPPELRDA